MLTRELPITALTGQEVSVLRHDQWAFLTANLIQLTCSRNDIADKAEAWATPA